MGSGSQNASQNWFDSCLSERGLVRFPGETGTTPGFWSAKASIEIFTEPKEAEMICRSVLTNMFSRMLLAAALLWIGSSAHAIGLFSSGTPDFQIFSMQYTYTSTGATTRDLTLTGQAPFVGGDMDNGLAGDVSNPDTLVQITTFVVHLVEQAGQLVLDSGLTSSFSILGFSTEGFYGFDFTSPLVAGNIDELLVTGDLSNADVRMISNSATGQLYDPLITQGVPFAGELGFLFLAGTAGIDLSAPPVGGRSGTFTLDVTTPVPVASTLPLVALAFAGLLGLRRRPNIQ